MCVVTLHGKGFITSLKVERKSLIIPGKYIVQASDYKRTRKATTITSIPTIVDAQEGGRKTEKNFSHTLQELGCQNLPRGISNTALSLLKIEQIFDLSPGYYIRIIRVKIFEFDVNIHLF